MGRRIKSKPQSAIHLRSSSPVPRREEGFGEVKSVRLKPRQRGSGLPLALVCAAESEGILARARAAVETRPRLRKTLRFNGDALIDSPTEGGTQTKRGQPCPRSCA